MKTTWELIFRRPNLEIYTVTREFSGENFEACKIHRDTFIDSMRKQGMTLKKVRLVDFDLL